MRYLILKKQKGEGCDYTIGCGMTYSFENFDGPLDDAIQHFTQKIAYPNGFQERLAIDGDNALTEVWVVPADVAVSVDLAVIRTAHKAMCEASERLAEDEKEKAELERLTKKWGPK
jgi:hypothetical protein